MSVSRSRTSLSRPRRALGTLLLSVWGATSPARALTISSPASRATSSGEVLLASSGDAYVRELRTAHGVRWRFGTALVEKQVQLDSGRLALVSFRDLATRHEFVRGASELLDIGWNGVRVTGGSTPWSLDRVATRRLPQGELLLELTLHAGTLAIVKSYLVYPKESIIQEWATVTNHSATLAMLDDPTSLSMDVLQGEAAAVDVTVLTGYLGNDTSNVRFRTKPLTAVVADTLIGTPRAEYVPVQIYHNRETQQGLFVGWDYSGNWRSTVRSAADVPVHIDFAMRDRRQLAPGERLELPKVFTGTFHGDFDELGHQLLDYQYRYKWDYTRAPYFPGTQIEPTWAGSSWGSEFDPVSLYRQVFAMTDLMRTIGADVFWRDNGWWNDEGDWDGPNWGETGRYLGLHGMRQIIYLPVQDASAESRVAREHPEWVRGTATTGAGLLDQAQPAVTDWELKTLEAKRKLWGDFEWRRDWRTVWGDSQNVEQDRGFRHMVRQLLDRNPGMAYNGCVDTGFETLGLAVSWTFVDVGSSVLPWLYNASYVFSPEKMGNVPDDWHPGDYTKGVWRGLLANRFPLQGTTEDPAKREGIRELFDIWHYLMREGVVGRWAWVYHPRVTGDSAVFYLERLSGDHRRGTVVLKHAPQHAVTIYPKGLLPNLLYQISYQESGATDRRSGSDLMAHGLELMHVPAGELIYLNLPLHPGSPADHTPPTPPTHVTQDVATHMDYTGVELRWRPGHDDNWVSYYQIYRNGVPIGKVAKGTYYFDHALGADLAARYAVATVDGSGNASAPAAAAPAPGPAALVVDDTNRALQYTGTGWEHQTGQWSVAYGTQARTNTPGNAVSYAFTGRQITWYGRLGPDNGIAAVYLDGQLDRLVDTYNAEDIPNVALYSRTFASPTPGPHVLKIVVTRGRRGGWIVVDGLQAEQTASRVVAATPVASDGGIGYTGTGWHRATASVAGTGSEKARTDSGESRPPEGNVSAVAGDAATYTFTGRGVTWVGRRCSQCGMADVYVDGQLETSVDTYVGAIGAHLFKGDEQWGVPVFTRRWPTSGRHVVKFVVRPDRNVWAKGNQVHLDALHIEQ